ncbi:lipopolysaccharide biosynthesis protein [Sphingobacterium griseoflavum]|uniref:Lipopolysaccharide biosynthesis protein n=1 Tax=Sphingobacterium griseoflavum TaxID=1474952 RepID=A0ABQ3I179_9SPHI|nr:lipopolysaccharide biosynthesis protein [Sphingobacterium griseoflavum]GHE39719.1 lipopolysaccharide biosynthesis protein [Sphingobacterium griseoflavum]
MSLKQQAFTGVVWTFAEQFGSQIVGFLTSLVLARLLLPADFGTIALFGVVMAIAKVFLDSGLAGSLIRTAEADERDYSTVFWFNLAAGLILYILVFFIAPLVSKFYDLPLLSPLIRVYALILLIDSFVTVQSVQFVKRLDFKTNFKIQLPSIILGGIAGVSFAYLGFGAWSLVYASLVQNGIFTLQYWLYSDWRPSFVFDKAKFKYHFNYGSGLMLSGLLDVTFNNIYTILIGKKYSTVELGFYNRADSLKQLPVNNISNALNKVSFPLFAKISHDDALLKDAYKKILSIVIFVIAPIIAFMVISAEPLIRFLLTDKWLAAVPYFQILAIAGVLYPIHAYNLNVLKVKGRSDLFLRLEIFKKILVVIVVLASLPFGIFGLLWGQVITSVLALFINTHYTGKFLKYSVFSQIRDLMPSLLLASLCALAVYFLDKWYFAGLSDLYRLCVLVLLYASLYLGIGLLTKGKEIGMLKELIFKR